AQPGDVVVDLVPGQLAALSGLGTLGDLDLQLGRVGQVVDGHSEARRGDLLDGTATPVAVAVAGVAALVLAALAGVRLAADTVHGDGEGLVRLGADRTERHGPGGEALDDVARRLHLLQRHRQPGRLQLHQTAQRLQLLALVVDHRGVFAVPGDIAGLDRVLQR